MNLPIKPTNGPSHGDALGPLSLPQGTRGGQFGLTNRQADLLAFIRWHIEDGFSPTFEEMAVYLNLKSKSSVDRLLRGLVERGHIRRLPNRARSIALCEEQT